MPLLSCSYFATFPSIHPFIVPRHVTQAAAVDAAGGLGSKPAASSDVCRGDCVRQMYSQSHLVRQCGTRDIKALEFFQIQNGNKTGKFQRNSVFWVTVYSPPVCVAGAEEERRGRSSRQ